MKEFTASVRLSRWQSNKEPYSGWTLEVTNDVNGTTILRVALDNDAIANLLSSQAAKSEAVVFDDEGVNRIGWVREFSSIYVDGLTASDWETGNLPIPIEFAMDEQGVSIGEGWDYKTDSRWNHHNATRDGYRVDVYRWVPVSD